MFLFIDESGDTNHFVLTAIKIIDPRRLEDIIYDARRKYIRNKKLNQRQLNDLNEFHEYLLNERYPEIKRYILTNLVNPKRNYNYSPMIYAVYAEKKHDFNQDREYCRLVNELLRICELNDGDQVIFDIYNNQLFQSKLYETLRSELNLLKWIGLSHQDSQKCKPIQIADCVAGCLRRSLLNIDLENKKLIETLIVKLVKK